MADIPHTGIYQFGRQDKRLAVITVDPTSVGVVPVDQVNEPSFAPEFVALAEWERLVTQHDLHRVAPLP